MSSHSKQAEKRDLLTLQQKAWILKQYAKFQCQTNETYHCPGECKYYYVNETKLDAQFVNNYEDSIIIIKNTHKK